MFWEHVRKIVSPFIGNDGTNWWRVEVWHNDKGLLALVEQRGDREEAERDAIDLAKLYFAASS